MVVLQILFLGVCLFGMALAAEYLWHDLQMDIAWHNRVSGIPSRIRPESEQQQQQQQ